MSARDNHRPCACGAELEDECPRCLRANPLGSMRIVDVPTRSSLVSPAATDAEGVEEA